MISNKQDLPAMNEANVIANDLTSEVVKFINGWLEKLDMEVVEDDDSEEPVVVSGGKNNGHGRVSLNFYFKKKGVKG